MLGVHQEVLAASLSNLDLLTLCGRNRVGLYPPVLLLSPSLLLSCLPLPPSPSASVKKTLSLILVTLEEGVFHSKQISLWVSYSSSLTLATRSDTDPAG